MIHIVNATYLGDYRIRLVLSDGVQGEVDLRDELTGEVFEPLRDPEVFRTFTVDPDLRTVVWPNGADLAPEFLHEQVRVLN